RRHRARTHHPGSGDPGRTAAHRRPAGDSRPGGSDQPLRPRLPALAGPARPHHPTIQGADPAAARPGQGAHPCCLCTTVREALERSVPRSGARSARRGSGLMLTDPKFALLRQLVAFGVLLLVWEAAGRLNMLNPLFFPSPSAIGAALWELFADGRIWPHLDATFT